MFQNIELWVKKRYPELFLFVLFLAAFNLFFNLGNDPVKDWDEARHGTTSSEMLHSGNWIKTTYLGETDYWNLKPPLGIWCIAASFKIFGTDPFALRFPSALSAFFCVLLVMLIAAKRHSKTVALFSGFILAMTFSFIEVHSGRTGDFDAMMTLLVTLEIFLLIAGAGDKNKTRFFLAVLTIPLSFLLKSFAAVIPLGILVLFLVFDRFYKKMNWRDWLLSIIILMLPIALWVTARYQQDGFIFISKMAGYDLVKRGTTALEGHSASVFYYLEPFLLYGFPWTWLFLFFFFRSVKINRDKKKKFSGISISSYFRDGLSWIWLAVPLAVVLAVQTKTAWYLDPIYPAIAVFVAWHLDRFFGGLKKEPIVKTMLVIFVCLSLAAEGTILAFLIQPAFSLALNKSGTSAELMNEIDFQKLVSAIPRSADPEGKPGNYGISIGNETWSQSRLFCLVSMKGLETISTGSTNKNAIMNGLYTMVKTGQPAVPAEGVFVNSNSSWSLYYKPFNRTAER